MHLTMGDEIIKYNKPSIQQVTAWIYGHFTLHIQNIKPIWFLCFAVKCRLNRSELSPCTEKEVHINCIQYHIVTVPWSLLLNFMPKKHNFNFHNFFLLSLSLLSCFSNGNVIGWHFVIMHLIKTTFYDLVELT